MFYLGERATELYGADTVHDLIASRYEQYNSWVFFFRGGMYFEDGELHSTNTEECIESLKDIHLLQDYGDDEIMLAHRPLIEVGNECMTLAELQQAMKNNGKTHTIIDDLNTIDEVVSFMCNPEV